MQSTFHIFMKDTGNKCLVGNAFRQSLLLKPPEILGRKPDIDAGIFLEHSLGVLLMPHFPIFTIWRSL